MSSARDNKKRIAKNTLFLYIRLIVVMGVSLFTVRVVLKTLGIEDYGIYNVVASFVTMFSFFTLTLGTGTTRFFSYALGEKDDDKLNKLFNISLIVFILLGISIFIIAEPIGLWFLNNKLQIPDNRLDAAFWVFQFSIISFIINLIHVPFQSLIMSYERMNVYAYLSVIEVILKLVVVYVLLIVPFDKLIVYAALLAFTSLIITTFYIVYCTKKFNTCKIRFYWETAMFKELFSFCGWNMIGALSNVLRSQGVNILLNMFFGPIVNAARGVAFQISNAMNHFVTSFYSSFRPQITKLYAANNIDEMISLMLISSRASFYLIFILALPVFLEVETLLSLWLVEVPDYTVVFTRLVIINSIIESLSYPLASGVLSTGKVKWYQIITGGLLILNLPLSYIFLKLGFPPECTMIIMIVVTAFSILIRLYFMRFYFNVSIRQYVKGVMSYIIKVIIISIITPVILHYVIHHDIYRLLIVVLCSIVSVVFSIYYLGLSISERNLLKTFISTRLCKFFNKRN